MVILNLKIVYFLKCCVKRNKLYLLLVYLLVGEVYILVVELQGVFSKYCWLFSFVISFVVCEGFRGDAYFLFVIYVEVENLFR